MANCTASLPIDSGFFAIYIVFGVDRVSEKQELLMRNNHLRSSIFKSSSDFCHDPTLSFFSIHRGTVTLSQRIQFLIFFSCKLFYFNRIKKW